MVTPGYKPPTYSAQQQQQYAAYMLQELAPRVRQVLQEEEAEVRDGCKLLAVGRSFDLIPCVLQGAWTLGSGSGMLTQHHMCVARALLHT